MVRLAVVGCGDNSTGYSAVGQRLQGAAFTATADPDVDKAGRTAHALGASVVSGSLDDLLERNSDAFDAVVVDAVNKAHATLVQRAAASGKHVLVETPLALSTEEADAAIDACQASGVRLMVGQGMRFMPPAETVKENLISGKLGAPGLLRIHRWETRDTGSWRRLELDADASGGTIMRDVIREIDLAHWLFGALPTEVYAVGRRQSHAGQSEPDYVQVHLGFPEGGMAVIDYAQTLPQGRRPSGASLQLQGGPGYFSLSMIGSTGAAYADDHHNVNLVYNEGGPSALDNGYGQGHTLAQLQEFVDAIKEDREPAITGADGRAAVQTAEAAIESMKDGSAVRLSGGAK